MAARNLRKLADASAKLYGVPPELFRRLIRQESGWNPDARNPSGATGLVQIHLPSHPDISEQQARDPAFALAWGARYLAAQKQRFGRWDLALAAYNAGPGNVEKHGGIPPFKETQNYVKSILGNRTPPVVPQLPPPRTPGKPALAPRVNSTPTPDLIGSVFQSNNQLIGIDTPSYVTELLSKLAAPPAAPVSPPLAGAPPVPQEPLLAPRAPTGGAVTGFVPAFKTALDRLLEASQGRVSVSSGFRSADHQAELFKAAVKKYGSEQAARKWVAPPGKSKHGEGVAADLAGDLDWVRKNAARFGLYQPLPHEPWHYELVGSRG